MSFVAGKTTPLNTVYLLLFRGMPIVGQSGCSMGLHTQVLLTTGEFMVEKLLGTFTGKCFQHAYL
jgi:hypothetical protein